MKFVQRVMNLALKEKILLIVLINVCIFAGVSLLGIQIVNQVSNQLMYQLTASTLSYSATDIVRDLDSVSRLSSLMIADNAIQRSLMVTKAPDEDIAKRVAYQTLYTTVQSYHQQFKQNHLSYISLYTENFTIRTYVSNALAPEDTIRDELVETALKAKGAPVMVTRYCDRYGLFLVRSIRQIQEMSLENLGVVILCIDPNRMVEAATDFSNQYKDSAYFLFDGQTPMLNTIGLSAGKSLDIQKQLTDPYSIITMNGKKYFAAKGRIPEYDWEYISLVDYNSIYESVRFSNLTFLLMILLCALLSVLLSNFLIRPIIQDFHQLIYKMKLFGRQKAELDKITDERYQYRTDEMGELHRQFDSMAKQIQNLITINYKNEILRKNAQIKALEMQINPHFLYNTLESVNWRAKALGEKKISQMVESLGSLLRITLSRKTENYSLREELELVRYYLTIQQIRFESRLSYRWEIDETLLDAFIPKLTIQPLVENAIHYGLEENIDTCRIGISAQRDGDHIRVTVRNSGSNFEENLLEKLENQEIKPNGLGIGLLNTHKRIRLTFGEQYGLTLENRNDDALVTLRIPYRPV